MFVLVVSEPSSAINEIMSPLHHFQTLKEPSGTTSTTKASSSKAKEITFG